MADDLSQQAASQQSPGAPVPLPINPAQAVMGVPPQPQSTAPTAAPQQPQPAQNDPVTGHLAAIGHAVKHFANALEGKQTVYNTDQATGNVTSEVVPRKPGGFFRDILLGAISGEAAASQNQGHPSGAAGLALGAQAGLKNIQQQQDARQKQAQDKGNEIKQTNADNLAQATIAHNTMNSLNFGHNLELHTPEDVERISAASDALKQQALKSGGQLVNLPGIENGKAGNGPAIMAAYNQNPALMQGPEGFHRIPLFSYTGTDGLQHDGQNWSDGEGSPDWNKNHGTVTLIDIPNALWNKQVTLTREQVNTIAGYPIAKGGKGSKPTDTMQATYGSLFALGLRNTKDVNDARNELYRAPQNEQEALALKAEAEQINGDPNAPDDLKRRAAIKGPLAEKWLAGQAEQKQAMEGDKPTKIQSLAEANDILTNPDSNSALRARATAWKKQTLNDQADAQARTDARKVDYETKLADAKERIKDQNTMGYAEDQNGNLNYVSKADASDPSKGYSAQTFSEMKPSEVAKDRALVRPLGDVQMNINHYRDAANAYSSANISPAQRSSDKDALTTIFSAPAVTDAAQAHAGVGAVGISVPTLSADLQAGLAKKVTNAYNSLSPQGKALADNYVRARAAIPAWVKALTNSGRGSKEQLDIELQNLLPPYYNINDVHNRLDGFQDNLDNQKHTIPQNLLGRQIPAPSTRGGSAPPPVKQGFTRIQASDGSMHDIPSGNLAGAKQIDPNLKVVGQ